VIAQALLVKACKGDVTAIRELANRVEGKTLQAVGLKVDEDSNLAERLAAARQRVLERMTEEELREKIKGLEEQLSIKSSQSCSRLLE
jgi:hypothetical protein